MFMVSLIQCALCWEVQNFPSTQRSIYEGFKYFSVKVVLKANFLDMCAQNRLTNWCLEGDNFSILPL